MREMIIAAMDVSTMGTAALYAAMEPADEESDSDDDEDASLEEQ